MGQCHFGEEPETRGTLCDNMETGLSAADIWDLHCGAKAGQKRCTPMTRDPSKDQKIGDTDPTGPLGSHGSHIDYLAQTQE